MGSFGGYYKGDKKKPKKDKLNQILGALRFLPCLN